MTNSVSLLIIKPLQIGRGQGPGILSDILNTSPLSLVSFRSWRICDTSWKALATDVAGVKSDIDYELEKIHAIRTIPSWICLFESTDSVSGPVDILNDICGPLNSSEWKPHHLRYKYSSDHRTDSVFHISKPERVDFESSVLFVEFNSRKV